MMRSVRARLFGLAIGIALITGVVCYVVVGVNHAELVWLADTAPLAAAVAAFAIAFGVGSIVHAQLRGSLHQLASATQSIVRDTARRVPAIEASPDDEVRQLAEWVNFLADDAERSHRRLVHERELLSTVAEGLTQGVIAVDNDHKIELLNDAARKMLGVSSTPVGEPLIEFMRVPAAFELLATEEAAQAEVQLPSGQRTLIRVARKWGSEGRVLLLEDVTTMRRLETVRRDFVANVSHELRTPVAVIRANAETLLAGAKDDPVMAPKLIDGLHRNAERLARILADLLDLSRLDA
ncbi:MAG TPA: histidine kinase dimerization/phospho-acceptor domain-containing protein, partial [Kofleriaceae bacterium]|nr:histidine kinase dimerization/phospho-acceptor domain-containing protein [Kofleriaceae bacterium]